MSVSIRRATYETAGGVIERLIEDSGLEVAGKRVFVKPNMLGEFTPEQAVDTHPAVLKGVIAALARRGALVIAGDNAGMRGYGANERAARRSGLLEAAGAAWRNIGLEPTETPAKSRFASSFIVSRTALDADLFISVPKFKTHVATVITGAIKNSYGLIAGAQKAHLHRDARGPAAFAEAVVDVYSVRPPDFVIVDGVVAMQGKGPSGKDLRTLNLLLAGTNGVEVDAAMAAIMGADPATIPLLAEAHRRGLGELNLARITVDGDLTPAPGFKLPFYRPERGGRVSGVGAFLARLFTYVATGRPVLRRKVCVRCGVCARQCPVDAITMAPYPTIDRDRCVLCYCCNEFCDYDAMDVQRRVRFFRRKPPASG